MNETVVRVGDAVWLGLGGAALALVALLLAAFAWDALRRRGRGGQPGEDGR